MTSHSAINWSACTGNVEDAKLAVQVGSTSAAYEALLWTYA